MMAHHMHSDVLFVGPFMIVQLMRTCASSDA